MIRIYYADNAIVIDSIAASFVAGTLEARLDGGLVTIVRKGGTYPFVARLWSDVAGEDGVPFGSPDALMAYLDTQFAMRRAVGGVVSLTAGTDLGGHRALMFAPDLSGSAVYADPSSDGYVFAGVSLGAAAAGRPIQAMVAGLVVEPSWTWDALMPVYVGIAGALTQSPPEAGLFHLLGFASSATAILLSPAPLVMLA